MNMAYIWLVVSTRVLRRPVDIGMLLKTTSINNRLFMDHALRFYFDIIVALKVKMYSCTIGELGLMTARDRS